MSSSLVLTGGDDEDNCNFFVDDGLVMRHWKSFWKGVKDATSQNENKVMSIDNKIAFMFEKNEAIVFCV